MKLTFLGHAAVLIEGKKNIIIDPFLAENPQMEIRHNELPKIDFVLVTHGHFDHLGDTLKIAKKNNAELICTYEISVLSEVKKAKVQATGMNIGGTYKKNGISFSMTAALHSTEPGDAVGFVIELEEKRIYHAGDTALFSDMNLIPRLFGKINVAFLPIGGFYVMDEKQASLAVRLLKPKIVVPIHYNTWPVIKSDPIFFSKLCGANKVKILKPGENIVL